MTRLEIPEERVRLIDENIKAVKRKMERSKNGDRLKYGYHFKKLQEARRKVFEIAQNPGYNTIK
jgi:hypothetical protein